MLSPVATSFLLAARPRTLPAAVAPVVLASAFAYHENQVIYPVFWISLCFAILVQVGTNFFNDYFDYLQGADTAARLGPVRVVAAAKISPLAMRNAGAISLLLSFCVGLGLIYYGGWALLIIGLLSIFCAVWYTAGRYSLAYLGLGDLFVILFFGFIATMTTYYLHTGEVNGVIFWAGLAVGLLTNNLLIINNYRDAPLDQRVGKNTLSVRFGREFSCKQLEYSCIVAFLTPLVFASQQFSWWVLLAWLLIPMQWKIIRKLPRARTKEDFQAILKNTSFVLIFFTLLTSFGIIIS